jgi:nucleoside-diphosphate-sugar epimerase
MRDLARLVVETVGSTTSRVHPADVEDPEERCRANILISKAGRELGWRPRIDLQAALPTLARDWAALNDTKATSGRHPFPDNA